MLLNKLQEDGVALCRKGRLKEAAHRFSYALRKLPTGDQGEHTATFTHLRLHLTLNLSRCKRKMNVSIFLYLKELEKHALNSPAHFSARPQHGKATQLNKISGIPQSIMYCRPASHSP